MDSRLCIFPSLFLILMSFLVDVAPRFPFDDGRHVVLNPTLLTWDEAVSACNEMNGTLLTVYDAGTLIDIGIGRKWIAWVGLKMGADDGENTAKWNSGELVTWSNWDNPGNRPQDRELCTVAVTIRPYEWTPVNCSTKWPSLCELHNGTCHFEVSRRSSLAGFNNDLLLNIGVETCRQRCERSETFYCMSFEYNSVWQFCQLSETHRWNEQAHFAFPDKEWNYYHRQCYTVYVDETWIPNGEIVTMTEEPITTTEVTTPRLPEETTKDGFTCVKTASLLPTENQTEEIQREVKELQELNEIYKERRRTQRKESATDPRPSARYLGSVALSITLCLLITVIVLDLLTFARHCPGGKAKHKHKVNFKRQTYPDFTTGKVIRLTPTWQSSVNATPETDHYSCPADLDDVDIRLKDEETTSNKADVVSLDIKALNTFEENANSYVSWPYDKSSPVLYPFHRSASEKAHQQRRSPHSLRLNKSERYPRSQSDSFFNKRIYVLPESSTDWQAKRPGLTKTDQLVMAYGHHFDNDDSTSKFYRSLKVGKLRRGSHC